MGGGGAPECQAPPPKKKKKSALIPYQKYQLAKYSLVFGSVVNWNLKLLGQY